jgi:hypothetical protein
MTENINDLEMHERTDVGYRDTIVIRVPGGLIYRFDQSAVFVPYNNFNIKYIKYGEMND